MLLLNGTWPDSTYVWFMWWPCSEFHCKIYLDASSGIALQGFSALYTVENVITISASCKVAWITQAK